MKPRPIYRWKSFWLGILVLAFMGWAWVRSMGTEDYLSWGTEAIGALVLTSQTGEVYLGWLGHTPEASFMLGVEFEHFEVYPPGEAPWFPGMVEAHATSTSRGIEVAHWFLIVVFLVMWLGWLCWRVRKQRKPIA